MISQINAVVGGEDRVQHHDLAEANVRFRH